jgi:hypothetical protein
MKVRLDFVSNSSSASFLLYIESNATNEAEFRRDMKVFLKDFFDERGYWYEEKDKEVEKIHKEKIESTTNEKTKEALRDALEKWKSRKPRSQMIQAEVMQAKQIATNVFEIESWTSMLNYLPEDLPDYIKHLIMLYVTGDCVKYGIKRLTLRVQSDH